MHRTSRAQNPAVVIIQQFARRLLAILERHRLHFGRVQARIQHFRGGPGSVRERRRRRREQSVDLFSRWATLAERQRGYTEADSRRYYETGMDFPGNGALRWHTQMEPGLWSSRRLPREHGIRGHDVGSPPNFFVVERIKGSFCSGRQLHHSPLLQSVVYIQVLLLSV